MRNYLSFLALALMAGACTRNEDASSKVVIQLPSSHSLKLGEVQETTSISWGVSDPTVINQVVCFGVIVGGPESALQSRTCYDSNGEIVLRAGIIVGIFPAGANISIDVPSGKNRTISIVGFAASSLNACQIFSPTTGPDRSHLSAPHIIGQTTMNLEPGPVGVTINVSLAGARKFNDCTGMETQPGTPPPASSPSPTPSPSYADVATGSNSTCARKSDGVLKCWGLNSAGQIGDGSTSNRSTPVLVDAGVTYQSIAIGSNGGQAHTCGITSSGVLKCWGSNAWGEVGDGTTTDRSSPVIIDAGTSYQSVSVGGNGSSAHSCGITVSGILKCWGRNAYGELGDGTTTNRTTPVVIGSSYAKVSVGDEYTCAINSSGVLNCWGRNSDYQQLGDGTATNRSSPVVIDSGVTYLLVSASYSKTCGVTSAGILKCWGTGYLGTGSSTTYNTPTVIDSGTTYSAVSPGSGVTCAITSTGSLKCWGFNGFGEVGNNSLSPQGLPTVVDSGINYQKISSGAAQTCGLTTSSILKCWGDNGSGQLGDGTLTSRLLPTPVLP